MSRPPRPVAASIAPTTAPTACAAVPALTLDTPVGVEVSFPGVGAPARQMRVRLRDAFRVGLTRGPALHALARRIVGVPPHELLTDDSPDTPAVVAVARRLAVLRDAWQADG